MHAVVVLPTYNEAGNIGALVRSLLALEPSVDVLVVDDDSPDGTAALAETLAAEDARVHVMRRLNDRGYSRSCVDGMCWALERDYDAVATMDADLSHDPALLPRMLDRLASGADLVIGSRYVVGGGLEVEWGPVRTAVSKLGSAYARTMLATRVRDCTSGYRCYRAEALREVDLRAIRSDGYSFIVELLAALTRDGARVEEFPITYVDRKAGESKISRTIVLEALVRTTELGARRILRL